MLVPQGKTYETAPYSLAALTQANKAKVPLTTLAQRDQDVLKQKFGDVTVTQMPALANPHLGGPVAVAKIAVPGRKARPFELSARFEDRDADGAIYAVELSLLATNEKALAEAKPKFDQMIKAY